MLDIPAKRALIDQLLEGNLDDYIEQRRSAGDSWRTLEADLRAKTGVLVSREALRRWYGEDVAA